MEIRQLEYFEAVSRLCNFTKAASEMHVSQPAITTAIKNMEEELGVTLLVRDKRKVMLTCEGEIFREKSGDLLKRFDQTISYMQELGDNNDRVVNIGITPIIGSVLNSLLYKGFYEKNQKAQFKVLELGSLGIMDAIDREEIDMGYLVLQENMEEIYDACRIRKGQLNVLVHKDNHLSERKGIRIEELRGEKLIYLPQHSYLRKKVDMEFERCQIVPHILAVPQQMITVFNLVENNVGISFVLGNSFMSLIPTENISAIPIVPPIYYETGFVWKQGKKLNRTARSCIEYVKQHLFDYSTDDIL